MTQSSTAMQRREAPRFITNDIAVSLFSGETQATGTTVDISEQGFSIVCNQPLMLLDRVKVSITFPDEPTVIHCRGEIVWGSATDARIVHGIKCTSFEQEQSAFLGYIERHKLVLRRDERRIIEQRQKESPSISKNKRAKERRITYPILMKCKRMSHFRKLMQQGRYLFLREMTSSSANTITMEGREYINLGSNNYLGLSTHPEVIETIIKLAEKYGLGSGGSRLLSGTMDLHNQLERKLAAFKGGEDCIVYGTGYTANLATTALIASGKNDVIVFDEKSHASLIDGIKFSGAQRFSFKHNDMLDLEKQIEKTNSSTAKLIITDGIFSMDGDIAKLDEIYMIAKHYHAAILVDDAHALGVIGKNGRGSASHFGLEGNIPLMMGTLSKSLGSVGGFVVADKEVIHALKHFSRAFVFSTSMPPLIAGATLKALEIIERDTTIIDALWRNIRQGRKGLLDAGFDLGHSEAAIIPVMVRDRLITYEFIRQLQERGIFANGIEYPAVKKNESMVRVSIMATHTEKQMTYFVEQMISIGTKLGLIKR
jgi:8-amino-7-oxononanoate synthase